ncbi:hypothetical protein DFH09DRAFT_1069214 [Mycena vulgaris]|nr:hypothetical protein DFH09DRAFT_1069214 [Mycena vulgaris]
MSFSALSVVLSASEDRLPRQHLADLAKCLGLSADLTASRIDLMSEPGKRRRRIVSEHSNVHTARVLFERDTSQGQPPYRYLISGVITPVAHYVPQSGNMSVLARVFCFNSGPGGGIEVPSIRMQTDLRRDTMLDVRRPDEADDADDIPTRPDDDDLMDVDEDPRILVKPECVEHDSETDEAVLVVCRPCSRDIVAKQVSALSIGT